MSLSPRLFLGLVLLAFSPPEAKESEVREAVFLGQIYPSGRIYLKQFPARPKTPATGVRVQKATGPDDAGERFTSTLRNPPIPLGALSPWPREVLAINTDPLKSPGTKVTRARFVKVLVDGPAEKKNHLGFNTEYIPGLEGMDSSHYPCGMSRHRQDTAFAYLSDDFFGSTLDHCESTQGVAVYQSDFVTEHSFRVMAFHKDWQLAEFTVDSRRTPRPLQPGESGQAGKTGAAPVPPPDETEAGMGMEWGGEPDGDCPYGRRFRDSARRLASVKISRPALDLELSLYRDPLCFMHWNDVYLLDVRKGGKRVHTLELINYKGMQ